MTTSWDRKLRIKKSLENWISENNLIKVNNSN